MYLDITKSGQEYAVKKGSASRARASVSSPLSISCTCSPGTTLLRLLLGLSGGCDGSSVASSSLCSGTVSIISSVATGSDGYGDGACKMAVVVISSVATGSDGDGACKMA